MSSLLLLGSFYVFKTNQSYWPSQDNQTRHPVIAKLNKRQFTFLKLQVLLEENWITYKMGTSTKQ